MADGEGDGTPHPRSEEAPKGWESAAAYQRFRDALAESKAAKQEADALKAQLAAAIAAKTAAEQEAGTVRSRASLDIAIVRAGITDDEDVAEIRDRYARVEAGEDGKRPTPGEWLAKLKEAPPRWFKGYLDDIAPAKPAAKVEEGSGTGAEVDAQGAEREAAAQTVKPLPADPNGGVVQGVQTRGRKIDDATVTRLQRADWEAARPTVARDLMTEGKVRMSPELLKRLGGA